MASSQDFEQQIANLKQKIDDLCKEKEKEKLALRQLQQQWYERKRQIQNLDHQIDTNTYVKQRLVAENNQFIHDSTASPLEQMLYQQISTPFFVDGQSTGVFSNTKKFVQAIHAYVQKIGGQHLRFTYEWDPKKTPFTKESPAISLYADWHNPQQISLDLLSKKHDLPQFVFNIEFYQPGSIDLAIKTFKKWLPKNVKLTNATFKEQDQWFVQIVVE